MFSSKRFLALAGTLIVLNVAGLIWIHYSLTHLPPQRLRVLEALPEVDAE